MNGPDDKYAIDLRHLERRFDRAAEGFDGADFVHAATRDGLLQRLEPVTTAAKTVLDLGSATGSATPLLAKRFRGARVISVDISRRMLRAALARRRWLSRHAAVRARADALPFADASIGMVFSNLLLPWIEDPDTVFREVSRVLVPGGLFAFTTLGPDSLLELRRAWQSVDGNLHVNRFPDMHDVGDGLVRAGLADPVLDVDRLTVTYTSPESLFRDLTAIGARNVLGGRSRGLCGRQRFLQMRDALSGNSHGDRIELELELVYGHCWGSGGGGRGGEIRVDAGSIRRRANRQI